MDRRSGLLLSVGLVAAVATLGVGLLGGYPSWFGLDAEGEPLVLVTDFGIVDAPAS